MKKVFALFFVAFLVAGCQTAPTTPSASSGIALLAKVAQRDERTIAYFDKDWELVKAPAAKGYYRKLYGKTAQGHYIAQDFYQDSKTKQVDPFEIISEEGLTNSDNSQNTGSITWYDEKGVKTKMRVYVNGMPTGQEEWYYPNGKVKSRGERPLPDVERMTVFYEDGSTLLERNRNEKSGAVALKIWYPSGKPAFDFDTETNQASAWNEQGKKLSDAEASLLLTQFMEKAESILGGMDR